MTTLATFVQRGLVVQFHRDPRRFVAILDADGAPGFLESLWTWARGLHGASEPLEPPLAYTIRRTEDEPRDVMLAMRFREVEHAGEAHALLGMIAEGHPSAPPIYARLFVLEHGGSVCEIERDGTRRELGITLAQDDDSGFEEAVLAELAR